jgi:hypothetical protein
MYWFLNNYKYFLIAGWCLVGSCAAALWTSSHINIHIEYVPATPIEDIFD